MLSLMCVTSPLGMLGSKPNLVNYGLTEGLRKCTLKPEWLLGYGINNDFIDDLNYPEGTPGRWGWKDGKDYWATHGRFRVEQFRSPAALAYFCDTSLNMTQKDKPQGYYRVTPTAGPPEIPLWISYRHPNDTCDMVFVDGHVNAVDAEEADRAFPDYTELP